MNIFITGVAGFIGSRTAQLLLDRGYNIVGVDNLNDYYDVRIKEHRLSILKKYNNFKFQCLDIESLDDMSGIFEENKFEIVINLAARAGVRYSLDNPFIYAQTNYVGSLNLLSLMQKHNVPKYVMASTSSVYAGSEMPYNEELAVNKPISPYAASKKAAELIAYTYSFQFNIDVTIVRYFTVYGPAGRPDMSILRFIKWVDEGNPIILYGDGTQSRDFTYIDDIAEGTICAALTNTKYEIINLGGGNTPVAINELISKIEKLLGKKAIIENHPFHKADIDSTRADIQKAASILGWEPKIGLDEGLEATVKWYQENKNWLGEISF